MPGYIKLFRDLQENPIWQQKPFSKGQAWVDMMFRCNHICKPISGYGDLKWVKRGEFVSSNYKLAEAWGWSESAVRNFMRQLEYNKMILRQSFVKCSLYFLQNYAYFQCTESECLSQFPNAQETHKKRTGNAQRALNKNDNNYKELKELINTYTKDLKLNETLSRYLEMRINKKKIPTEYAMELIFKTLKPFSTDIQIKMLEKSIINTWTDVFPPKEQDKPKKESETRGINQGSAPKSKGFKELEL